MIRAAVLLVLAAASAFAEGSPWRTYGGSFTSRWLTTGRDHGHDQPRCAAAGILAAPLDHGRGDPDCDPSDFGTANLDNSIGFRFGRERDVARLGPFRAAYGYEGSISFTEYNLSQRELTIFGGALTAGGDLELLGTRVGVRLGGGPYVSNDSVVGLHSFRALHATLPLRGALALRISRHDATFSPVLDRDAMRVLPIDADGARVVEMSAMVVGAGSGGDSKWELGAAVGATAPGIAGSGLGLRTAAFDRLTVAREIRSPRLQGVFTFSSSAHESTFESEFLGYRGNYRSKTINGFGFAARRLVPLAHPFTFTWGGGVEVAEWSDDHALLVDGGEPVDVGMDAALTANAAVRWKLARSLALEASAEQLWWHATGLGELRVGVGMVLLSR